MAQQAGDAGAVYSRRHDQEPQILAQSLLRVARQSETEIGVERSLVEFVEQHGGDAVEHRIVEDEPGKNAFGDDFDAGLARDLGAEAYPKPHRLADAFAERVCHPLGGGARREPARFEHQDATALCPGRLGEHQRDSGGFAGAGRRHQHGRIPTGECSGQLRQRGIDGKRRVIHLHSVIPGHAAGVNPESIVTTI